MGNFRRIFFKQLVFNICIIKMSTKIQHPLPQKKAAGSKLDQRKLKIDGNVGRDSQLKQIRQEAERKNRAQRLSSKVFKGLCSKVLKDVRLLNAKLREILNEQSQPKPQKKICDSKIFIADHFGYTSTQQSFKRSIRKLLALFNSHEITQDLRDLNCTQYILLNSIDIYFQGANKKKLIKSLTEEKSLLGNSVLKGSMNIYSTCEQELLELAATVSEIKFHPYYSKMCSMLSTNTIKITGISFQFDEFEGEKQEKSQWEQGSLLCCQNTEEKQQISEDGFENMMMMVEDSPLRHIKMQAGSWKQNDPRFHNSPQEENEQGLC